ncbi:MAG: MFS transporter [Rhodospirillaceae bacterium]|nr:MFS transporter [Rhodospirillaceae bacterium]
MKLAVSRTELAYGLGAIGYAAGLQVVNVLLLRFMTDDLAIAAGVAGTILAVTKLVDAVEDPLVGYLSDRTRSRWGRRRPYLIAGALVLPLMTAALFNPPALSANALAGYMLVMLLAHSLAYTFFVVPYTAIGAEIIEDYHARSTLMSFRVYGGSLGLLMAATVAPWLLATWGSDRDAHGIMGLVLGLIVLACCLISAAWLTERRTAAAPRRSAGGSWLNSLKLAFADGDFARIVGTHIVFQIGVATVVVSTAYFSRHVLAVSDYWLGTFYMAKVAGNLVSVPLWLWLAKRIDKPKAYMASLIVYGLLNLSWLLSGPHEPLAIVVARNFVVGIGMGGAVLLAYSLLADVIRYDQLKTGLDREGMFSGAVSFIDKVSGALGTAGIGFLLSAMGYVAGAPARTPDGPATQPDSALTAIYLGFCVVPGLAALACVAIMSGYGLTRAKMDSADPQLAAGRPV